MWNVCEGSEINTQEGVRFTDKRHVDSPLVLGHKVVLPRKFLSPLLDQDLVQGRGPLAHSWCYSLHSICVAVDVAVVVLGLQSLT